MKIILLTDVENLGEVGDIVDVADGYGRNYLLPRKLAVVATTKNRLQMAHEQRVREHRILKTRQGAEALAARLQTVACRFERKVGEEGRLFGSVTSMDIAEQLLESGFEVDRRRIQLDQPIRSLGEFTVGVRLQANVAAEFKVTVVAEEDE